LPSRYADSWLFIDDAGPIVQVASAPASRKDWTFTIDRLPPYEGYISKDKKTIEGILIGGANVSRAGVDAFVRGQLAQAIIMDDLASNKPPARVGQLAKLVEAERQKMLKPLLDSYGKPEPVETK